MWSETNFKTNMWVIGTGKRLVCSYQTSAIENISTTMSCDHETSFLCTFQNVLIKVLNPTEKTSTTSYAIPWQKLSHVKVNTTKNIVQKCSDIFPCWQLPLKNGFSAKLTRNSHTWSTLHIIIARNNSKLNESVQQWRNIISQPFRTTENKI